MLTKYPPLFPTDSLLRKPASIVIQPIFWNFQVSKTYFLEVQHPANKRMLQKAEPGHYIAPFISIQEPPTTQRGGPVMVHDWTEDPWIIQSIQKYYFFCILKAVIKQKG